MAAEDSSKYIISQSFFGIVLQLLSIFAIVFETIGKAYAIVILILGIVIFFMALCSLSLYKNMTAHSQANYLLSSATFGFFLAVCGIVAGFWLHSKVFMAMNFTMIAIGVWQFQSGRYWAKKIDVFTTKQTDANFKNENVLVYR